MKALAKGAGLFGLAVIGFLGSVLVIASFAPGFGLGMVFLLPAPILFARKAAGLARRYTLAWTGVSIATPYTPAPPPPVPQPDGWYRRDRQLYRKPWLPSMMANLDWLLGDNATWRDLAWMLLSPFTGGLIAVLPAALIGAGISMPFWLDPWWVGLLAGAFTVLIGLAAAPYAVRATARFNKRMLGGPLLRSDVDDPRAVAHPVREWFGRALVPVLKLAVLFLTSILGVLVFAATVAGLVLGYGLGLFFLVPMVLEDLRWLADWRRGLAPWTGVSIPRPYRPFPEVPRSDDGLYRVGKNLYKTHRWAMFAQRALWLTKDPATWREVLWRGTDPIIGGLIAGVPVLLVGYGIWGFALPRVVQLLFDGHSGAWYGHVAGQAWPAIPVGLLLAWVGIALAPKALKLHGLWSKLLLGANTDAVLAQRVEQLTVSRAEASNASAAELRRIERDLHDGTQARLVALGLSLAAIERLMDTDPPAAKELIGKTREAAATALRELREVVRGVHPPVLAERGLVDAVRALALDSPVTARVSTTVTRRFPDPIEAAAYFAVAEALGNAARHAEAANVDISLDETDDLLRIVVRDDGHGGADPGRGSGLRGLARRLGIFDGTVAISSPRGGPTELTMEIPCASSLPRTSTS